MKDKKVPYELVIDEFSESAHKVRRNLMVFSAIALFYRYSGAKVGDGGISIYGINFTHVDERFITIALLTIVIYHFMHFATIAFGHWKYLQIRTTRSDLGSKNSTLHSWFVKNLEHLNREADQALGKLEHLKRTWQEGETKNNVHYSVDATIHLKFIKENLTELLSKEVLSSIKKFEKSLDCYQGVEKCRWVIIEILIPLILGVWAFCVL